MDGSFPRIMKSLKSPHRRKIHDIAASPICNMTVCVTMITNVLAACHYLSQSRVSRLTPNATPAARTTRSRVRAAFSRAPAAMMPRLSNAPIVTTIGLSPLQKRGSSRTDGDREVLPEGIRVAVGSDGAVASIIPMDLVCSSSGTDCICSDGFGFAGRICLSHLEKNHRSATRESGLEARSSKYARASPPLRRLSLASLIRASGTVMYHQYPNGSATTANRALACAGLNTGSKDWPSTRADGTDKRRVLGVASDTRCPVESVPAAGNRMEQQQTATEASIFSEVAYRSRGTKTL
eukprot:scaffold200659_cov33-Tisochrysis_lutea.AAC.1